MREIAPGLNADLDAKARAAALDIDHASTHLDLTKLETVWLPDRLLKAA